MFRTRSRVDAPVDASNRNSQGSGEPPDSSHWRPSLRRIGKNLFSSRDNVYRLETRQRVSFNGPVLDPPTLKPLELPPLHSEPAPAYPRNADAIVARGYTSRTEVRPTPATVQVQTATTRERPKGPREPPPSQKGFDLFKRTFSKSRKQTVSSSEEPIQVTAQEPERRNGQAQAQARNRLTKEPTPTHAVGDFPRPAVQKRQSAPVELLPRPTTTAGYLPKHAASDFSRGTTPRKPVPSSQAQSPQVKAVEVRPTRITAAYVPKHAAADFSKLSVVPRVDPNHPLIQQYKQGRVAIRPTPHESQLETSDYENFLEASRKAAVTTATSRWGKSSTLSSLEDPG